MSKLSWLLKIDDETNGLCLQWVSCMPNVDYLKITEDKSSDSRVYISDTRLIKATHCNVKTQSSKPASQHYCNVKMQSSKPAFQHHAVSKCEVWNPHPSITAMPRRKARSPRLAKLEARVSAQSLKPASQTRSSTQSLKLAFQHHRDTQMRSSRTASSVTSTTKRRAQARIPTEEEPHVSVITALITGSITVRVNEGN